MDRVLFVDDERNLLKTLERQLLKEPYEKTFVLNAEEGLKRLSDAAYSVIVSDMRMPGMNGVSFLIAAKKIAPDVRRIILTGYVDINSAMDAINKANVHSYLVKPWDEEQLKETIREELANYRAEKSSQKDRQRLLEQAETSRQQLTHLQKQATTDALTGLANRRSFETFLQTEWRRAQRDGSDLTLVMIDIDKFKLVNDIAGHAEGDRILAVLAKQLKKCLRRPGDFIARYGGEEFVAILPNTHSSLTMGERFRSAVESLNLSHPGMGPNGVITISIGVAVASPSNRPHMKAGELLRMADEALYASKHAGGNRVSEAPSLDEAEETA